MNKCTVLSAAGYKYKGPHKFANPAKALQHLRKVFDDDMDVDTRYMSGSVGNAEWMLRVYVGYEF